MTLPAGTRLGPYEILSPLGAGGMGEVYRARDSKLDREVALKVLPEKLAQDADALARFEREAKAVAALSHPNILAIHDFGRHDGVAFAVMELLEGQTLRERLDEGRLPVRKAIDYAVQVANGLAAAHEKGIVHRDLKPENLFVTKDGRVKILDFGLAKVVAPSSEETHSPTVVAATEPGSVMGTVGYMSPEQVRGKTADHRSDIFSFGSILYEMLTGRRAFRGDSAAETMAAIAQTDPPELESANATLPPGLGPVVRHCLEKSPSERFQSAGDLAFALSSASGSSARHEPLALGTGAVRPAKRWGRAATGAAIAALAFLLGWWLRKPPQAQGHALRATFERLTDSPGVEGQPTLSPDGKSVAYVSGESGNDDIYLLRIGGRNPINLTADSPDDDETPAFSPDGSQIAFRSERQGGGIFVMGATGESVKRLTDFGYNPSWSPDGRRIAVSTTQFAYPTDRSGLGELWAVDLASGAKRPIWQGGDAAQPSWSPHGQRIAFWGLRGQSGRRDLWTVAADGSGARTGAAAVTDDSALDFSPAWSPDGRFLYFASDRGGTMNLWRIPIDEGSGRVLGEAESITTPSGWSGWASLSRDGKALVYASVEFRSTLLRVGFDPDSGETTGSAAAVMRSTLPIRDHAVSPDGKRVAFTTAGREDLFVVGTDGSSFRRMTDDAFRDRGPAWSPDGQRLVFYSDRSGGYQLWSIRPDGSGMRQLSHLEGAANFPVWAPDGSRIATVDLRGQAWRILDSERGSVVREFTKPVREGVGFWPLSWSPDGGSVLGLIWVRSSGATLGLAVCSLADGHYDEIYRSASQFFLWPAWLRDGRRVLLRHKRGISMLDSRSGQVHPLVAVAGYTIGESVGISKDNRWITYTETATEGDIWLMRLDSGDGGAAK
jgi:Tol biopolymer transport system component/tRNA A-37 threonylcarbamoyl transferase component Bud32